MANIDSILSLKVFIQTTGLTKTFRFGSEMAVAEVIREVKSKSNITTPVGDHGLFLPPNPETGKKAVWLERNKALRFYNIPTGTTLEFKKKHRPLRVILADGSRKMVVVDDSQKTRDIADEIGKKIGLKLVQEFSLRKLQPVPVLDEKGRVVDEKKEKVEKGEKGEKTDKKEGPKVDANGKPLPMPWLKETQCLHEQGITADEELEYRKKYFFGDDQVEKEDTFTLHLLYVESLDAIIDGRYPCTKSDAKNFCAFQMQVVYGDHNEATHTVGFIDKNNFLPALYRKDDKKQTFEREILMTHSRLKGVKADMAKYRFVQLVRSLKFYGITFFDQCKMRVPGKKELQPFLWGISKEKIYKYDAETQKEISSWKYEELRKWTSDRGNFTLDFGDNADEPQQITTVDADAMSELIAGYIDIILRMRTDENRVVENDDDDIALETEGYGETGIAQISFAVDFADPYGQGAYGQAMFFPGEDYQSHGTGEDSLGRGEMAGPSTSLATNSKPPPTSSKINVIDVGSAIKCAKLLAQELGGKRLNQNSGRLTEQEWSSQFKGHQVKLDKKIDEFLMSAKLHQGPAGKNELDKQAGEILQELKGMCSASGCLKDLNDENLPLMDGTKALADCVGQILDLVLKATEAPPEDFAKTLQLCQKVWDTSKMLLAKPTLCNYTDKGTHMLMASCIQDVNVNMDALLEGILSVKPNEKVLQEADKCKQVKGMAVTCLGNLINQILDPDVHIALENTTELVKQAKMSLVGKCQLNGVSLGQNPLLLDYSERIDTALANLVECAVTSESRGIEGHLDIQTPLQHYLSTLASLRTNIANPTTATGLVKQVVKEQNDITKLLKSLGQNQSKELVQRLQNTTVNMNALTQELITEGKIFIKDPTNLVSIGKGQAVIGKLETCSQELLVDAGEIAAMHNLRYNAKASTAAILQLAAFSTSMSSSCSNPLLREQLLASAKSVQGSLSGLLASIQGAALDPSNLDKQNDLKDAAKNQLPLFDDFKDIASQLSSALTSPQEKQAIETALRIAGKSLNRMNTAIGQLGNVEGQAEIEAALQEIDAVKQELVTAQFFAEQGKLKQQPGKTRDAETQLLGAMADHVEQRVDDLINDAKGGDIVESISQLVASMAEMATSSQTTAGTIPDRQQQKKIIGHAKDALDDTVSCISLARAYSTDPNNPEKLNALNREKEKLHQTIQNMNEAASAIDTKHLNQALQDIEKAKVGLTKTATGKQPTFKDSSNLLNTSTKALLAATNQLGAVVKTNPQLVGSVAKMTGATTSQLLTLATACASSSSDSGVADMLLLTARSLADAMKNLLNGAKNLTTNRTPFAFEEFALQQSGVKDAAENLIAALGDDSNPDVSFALKNIMANLELFEADQISAQGSTRENLLAEFVASTNHLTRLSQALSQATKVSANKHGQLAKETAAAIESLLTTAQSANKSDGSISSMTIDGAKIIKAIEEIQNFPDDLQKMANNVKILNVATSKLIATARDKIRSEPDKNLRTNIVNSTQALATCAQNMSMTARGINPKIPQTIDTFLDSIGAMKESTLELEDSLRAATADDADENIVEPDLAAQLSHATRILAQTVHEVVRATSVVAANNQARVADIEEQMDRRTRAFSAQQIQDTMDREQAALDAECAKEESEDALEQCSILLADLLKSCAALNPGVKECDRAISDLQSANGKIEAALFASEVNNLYRDTGVSFQQGQLDTAPLVKEIGQDIQVMIAAAGGSSTGLKRAAEALREDIIALADKVELTAASVKEQKTQKNLLTQAKLLNDELKVFVTESQSCNLNDKESVARVAAASNNCQNAIGGLLGELQSGAQLQADLDRICQIIKGAMNELPTPLTPSNNYGECRESLTIACKALAHTIAHLYNVDKHSTGQIGVSAARVGDAVPSLIKSVRLCAATTKDPEAAKELIETANLLGTRTIHIVLDVKQITLGHDVTQKFQADFKESNLKITALIDAARRGAVGDILIDKAIEGISKRITMLNTAAIFAEAGQLEPNKQTAQIAVTDLQAMIERDSGKLTEACNNMIKAVKGGSDEDLGNAATVLEKSLEQVANISMALAQKVPDNLTQQDVLGSTKLIGFATHQLILACKDAQKLPDNQACKQAVTQAFVSFQESTKAMLGTVKDIGDEAARAERDMNKAIEAIKKAKTSVKPAEESSPDDVIAQCKLVLQASAQLIYAGNQKELTEAGEESVKAIEELLSSAKTMAGLAPDKQVGSAFTDSINKTTDEMIRLLQICKLNRAEESTKAKLEGQGEVMTASINGIIASLRRFTNIASAQEISLDKEGDLDSLSEQELLKCAQIIEEAFASLTAFNMPTPQKRGPRDLLDLNSINASIVDAATAIAKATSQLVAASVTAQRDRSKEARAKGGARYHADPMWANGLISASQGVAASVKELVSAANVISEKGKGDEASLIASARGVAASTAHLVAASRTKADPNAPSQRQLQVAAKSVAQATAKLVDSAQSIGLYEEAIAEPDDIIVPDGGIAVGGVRLEMEQNIKILNIEKQLEQERQRRAAFHTGKYKK